MRKEWWRSSIFISVVLVLHVNEGTLGDTKRWMERNQTLGENNASIVKLWDDILILQRDVRLKGCFLHLLCSHKNDSLRNTMSAFLTAATPSCALIRVSAVWRDSNINYPSPASEDKRHGAKLQHHAAPQAAGSPIPTQTCLSEFVSREGFLLSRTQFFWGSFICHVNLINTAVLYRAAASILWRSGTAFFAI